MQLPVDALSFRSEVDFPEVSRGPACDGERANTFFVPLAVIFSGKVFRRQGPVRHCLAALGVDGQALGKVPLVKVVRPS